MSRFCPLPQPPRRSSPTPTRWLGGVLQHRRQLFSPASNLPFLSEKKEASENVWTISFTNPPPLLPQTISPTDPPLIPQDCTLAAVPSTIDTVEKAVRFRPTDSSLRAVPSTGEHDVVLFSEGRTANDDPPCLISGSSSNAVPLPYHACTHEIVLH